MIIKKAYFNDLDFYFNGLKGTISNPSSSISKIPISFT